MTTSFIFCNNSSLLRLGRPRLLKIGSSKAFQLLIDVNKKVYFGHFDLKRLIAACVPLQYAYFSTSFLTREGMLVLYEEPFLPFFLLKLSSSAFTSDTSAAVTLPVALTLILKYLSENCSSYFFGL